SCPRPIACSVDSDRRPEKATHAPGNDLETAAERGTVSGRFEIVSRARIANGRACRSPFTEFTGVVPLPVVVRSAKIGGGTMMNQRLLAALTLINLGLLSYQIVRPRLAFADEPAQVLRGRALEIVDERGKVRAELRVFPADPKHRLPNGD